MSANGQEKRDTGDEKAAMNSYRLVLADESTPFRQTLRMVLSEKPGIEVIGEAGDGFQLMSLLDRVSPNMVTLDISMPKFNGIEGIRRIRKNHPDVKVLVLTSHSGLISLYEALTGGAEGYLLKRDNIPGDLFSAIEMIQKGGAYVSRSLTGRCPIPANAAWPGRFPGGLRLVRPVPRLHLGG